MIRKLQVFLYGFFPIVCAVGNFDRTIFENVSHGNHRVRAGPCSSGEMHLTPAAAALIKGPRGRPAVAPSSAKRFREMING